MRPAWRLGINSLSGRRSRSLLLIAAVALSAALITAVSCAMASLNRGVRMRVESTIGAADLRLPTPRHETATALPPQEAVADLDPANAALPSYIEQMERAAIQKALEENRWNRTRTAAQLGITFRALRYKLKKLGMD